jgi:plastocyanin
MSSKWLPALLLSLVALPACSPEAEPPPPPKGGGQHVDAATASTLAGRVVFTGTPPARESLRMSTDPACVENGSANALSDAVLVNATGAVQNVFVYIKAGVDPAYSFEMPTAPVVLDQKGCRYVPRVLGVRAGQPMEIVNDDPTLHNVHALPMANQEFNKGEPVQGARMTHTFTVPEVMVRFKCDVHGWMSAYVGVMAHPFFAVTDADGNFEIKGVPPGGYTVAAWHEKFGTLTQEITVADREAKRVSFSFKPQ